MKRRAEVRGVIAIDQAESSGFASCPYRPGARLVASEYRVGVALTPSERLAALTAASEAAGGWEHLAVVFEDHSDFYFGRGNASVATLLGLGAYRGRWEEQLDTHEHPRSHRHKVTPKVWRRAVLGLASNVAADRAKATAQMYAHAALGHGHGHDASEAFCILRFACLSLLPSLQAGRSVSAAASAIAAAARKPAAGFGRARVRTRAKASQP